MALVKILSFLVLFIIINNARATLLPPSQLSVVSVDSEETVGENNRGVNAIDGNSATLWHSKWFQAVDPLPHNIVLNLGAVYTITGFEYLPRQDGSLNGIIASYNFEVSLDSISWTLVVPGGIFAFDSNRKIVSFPGRLGKFIRLTALSEILGQPFTSAAELSIDVQLGTTLGPINLAWDAPIGNTFPVITYDLFRRFSTEAYGLFLTQLDSTTLTYSDTVGPNISICYVVKVNYGASGVSGPSNEVCLTTPSPLPTCTIATCSAPGPCPPPCPTIMTLAETARIISLIGLGF